MMQSKPDSPVEQLAQEAVSMPSSTAEFNPCEIARNAVRLTIEACAKVADEYQRHNSHSCPREIAKRIRAILNNGAQHGQR